MENYGLESASDEKKTTSDRPTRTMSAEEIQAMQDINTYYTGRA